MKSDPLKKRLAFVVTIGLFAAGSATAAEPTSSSGWTTSFQSAHSKAWSGGDQSNSIRTAGNKQVYFIHGDTATLDEQMDSGGNGAGTYIPGTPGLVPNSIVRFASSVNRVVPATVTTEAVPSPAGTALWGMDLTEANGAVYALLADHNGWNMKGGYLAKFTENSDGTLTPSTGVIQLPYNASKNIHWVDSILTMLGTIYIYGHDDSSMAYVSKIAANLIDYGFLGSWNVSYWTGSSWSSDQATAAPISSHVFRSVRVANGYLVATYRDNGYVGNSFGAVRTSINDQAFVLNTRKEKTFSNALVTAGQMTSAGNVPNPRYSVQIWTYCPTLHPELKPSSDTSLMVGIDWNVVNFNADFMKNAQAYKPRFFTIPSPNTW